MEIKLNQIKPTFMSQIEIEGSMVYNQELVFKKQQKTLIKANSGKGKSSLLNFIFGTNKNYSGSIEYELKILNKGNLKTKHLSYVFQDLKLFDELTILENILLKNELTQYKAQEEIEELIDLMQLSFKTNTLVKSLSLGQKQRVAIIRAVCQPFDYLLMDEPFSHLDPENISIIISVIEKELSKQEAGLIITTLSDNNYFDYDKILNL